MNNNIIHKPAWSSSELEIIYKNYSHKTYREIAELLPNRSISAVKNKVKKVKFGR